MAVPAEVAARRALEEIAPVPQLGHLVGGGDLDVEEAGDRLDGPGGDELLADDLAHAAVTGAASLTGQRCPA
jgi:hypothetical protein